MSDLETRPGRDETRTSTDPSADPRAKYTYTGGPMEAPSAFEDDLQDRVSGEVRFDTYSRNLYATDASAYEQLPIGVIFPEDTADVSAAVSYCADRDIPVLPRGGGTSLAGQAVNKAVVLDFSQHMSGVVEANPTAGTVNVRPGTVLADLNDELEQYGLKFAPDPAAGDRSVIGGAIGNNSTGAHSLKYGKTDAYVEEIEVVLADGTVTTFGRVSLAELRARADRDGDLEARIYAELLRVSDEYGDEIESRYPDLKRNVSGYNLDALLDEIQGAQSDAGDDTVNVARALVGSEGTLAVVTGATLSLEPIPETKAVALLTYDSLGTAMEDVHIITSDHDPAAVEAIDDVLLDLAGDTEEFADIVELLPDGTDTALLVEFYAESTADAHRKVDSLVEDRVGDGAFDVIEAYEADERKRLWKLRKSANPILLGRTSDEKHISFIEDAAVPTENLAAYIDDFQTVLADQDTFASFYAHAGPGCMHVRPLVNSKSVEGISQMRNITDAVTDLVVEYGGSVSGEHGDGRARTEWNRKLYGETLWTAFRELKRTFDPSWLLNPGQVCGYHVDENPTLNDDPERANAVRMTENLRFDPDYDFQAGFDPELRWENENGFQGMVELCHGCGGCRGSQETTGGVMCPTFRAAQEESTSTRGRANLLRQAMSGDLPDEEQFDIEFMREVLDLCIGCKGCSRDCPSEVDLAKMKVEVEHEHHKRDGASLRDHIFARVNRLNQVGSILAPLSNWAHSLPGSRVFLEKTLGIARERSLPTFASRSFVDWFEERGPHVSENEAVRKAILVPDPYTNYNHPAAAKAAIRVLEAAGVHTVVATETGSSGRPAFSKGFIETARQQAESMVDSLQPRAAAGWDIVFVEPSDAVMVQSDYADLLSVSAVERVAANTYGICEYLDIFRLDEHLSFDSADRTLTYHGHCHQKAVKKDHHAVGVLRRSGYQVDPLDSGCCGMAGSFGYEAEHYSMSRAIGDILIEQVSNSDGEEVVAPGASCRTQLADSHHSASHPIEKISDRIEDG